MSYPIDPAVIAALSDEEYAALMRETWNAPLPRVVVFLSRRAAIQSRLDRGMSRAEAGAELNLSVSMISLILSGKRD